MKSLGEGAFRGACRTRTRPGARFVASLALLLVPIVAAAELEEGEHFQLFVADRYTYEDNLYRLAENEDIAALPLGERASREDYINRVTIGIEGAWQISEQAFHIGAHMDDSRYQNNSDLDNTGGDARANWNWRMGSNLSGQLGADYARFQAGFENNRLLQKDVLDTVGTFWNATLRVGPHWRLKTSARHAEIEHGATARRFDNSDTDYGSFGVHYETSRGDTYGWDYRYAKAHFEQLAYLNGQLFDRNYKEHTTVFSTQYALGTKMALAASVGYLRREFPRSPTPEFSRGSFSGGIWDATLQWRPTGKSSLNLSGWRKLRAYLNAETDYFVATGGSIEPVWNPTAKISVRLEYSIEDQDYLGPSVNIGVLEPRHDRIEAQQLSISYSPIRMLQLSLSGRIENRDSDRSDLKYDARRATVGVRVTF